MQLTMTLEVVPLFGPFVHHENIDEATSTDS